MTLLLDGLQDELTPQEQELAESAAQYDEAIAFVFALRCAVKSQSITRGLYLPDASIDAVTAMLLSSS